MNDVIGSIKKIYLAPLLLVIPILVRAYLPLIGVTELLIVPMFCIGVVNICERGSYFFLENIQ